MFSIFLECSRQVTEEAHALSQRTAACPKGGGGGLSPCRHASGLARKTETRKRFFFGGKVDGGWAAEGAGWDGRTALTPAFVSGAGVLLMLQAWLMCLMYVVSVGDMLVRCRRIASVVGGCQFCSVAVF